MSHANPLISVILATYNRARFLRAALESILQQAYSPIEIIVVDDGSTDDTPEIVNTLIAETAAPIHYVQQPNRGAPAAHNQGLRLARGEVITFIDSDDLWPAERLPAQMALFAPAPHQSGAPAPAIVLGREQRFADGVSVNAAELAAALTSILHQEGAGIQIIVVDDGSTDYLPQETL
jgi:glycosyltransferase involved in cell wall biosynthesis